MRQHTGHGTRYPGHWPLLVPRPPATLLQQPSGPAAPAEKPSAATSAYDGELVTAPWMGLHYRTEDI